MIDYHRFLSAVTAAASAIAVAACSETARVDAEEPAAGVETSVAAAEPASTAQPALWSASDDDTTVHLFGTVHILKPNTQWRYEAVDEAFAAADAVYFEADTSSTAAQAQTNRLITQLGLYTDGRKLSDILDADDEREVVEALDIMGVPLSSYEPMQPWLAGMTMGVQFLVAQGYSAGSGVETVLAAEAEAQGKPLRYLESIEQQLRFFADLPEDDQVDFLVASAISIEDEPDQLDVLVEEWASGDIDALSEMLSDVDAFGSRRVYDTLLTERNTVWVDEITSLLDEEEGVFFMAVGAAHLAGDKGVPALLRAQGVKVDGP